MRRWRKASQRDTKSIVRLWTLHPQYLDPKGLVAAWREGLLAQKVLAGETKGYQNHPQLVRFKSHPKPMALIASFLRGIAEEADRRGYHFDTTKISGRTFRGRVVETRGQLLYEWSHLKAKLRKRAPECLRRINSIKAPKPHPLFRVIAGVVRPWEKR
jgi:hypothetical protein